MKFQIKRRAAHRAVTRAIKNGTLVPEPCKICGKSQRVEAHHPDYDKPLQVDWLCSAHHREKHKRKNTRHEQPPTKEVVAYVEEMKTPKSVTLCLKIDQTMNTDIIRISKLFFRGRIKKSRATRRLIAIGIQTENQKKIEGQ